MSKIVFFTMLFLVLISVEAWSLDSRKYEVSFSKDDFTFIKDDVGVMHISPKKQLDFSVSGDTTHPALPYTTIQIGIPSNTEVSGFSFDVTREHLFSDVEIAPCPRILPTDSMVAEVNRTESVNYSEKQYPFQNVALSSTVTLQGYKYVCVILNPFIYNASEKKLDLIAQVQLSITLKTTEGEKSTSVKRKEGRQKVSQMVINAEEFNHDSTSVY